MGWGADRVSYVPPSNAPRGATREHRQVPGLATGEWGQGMYAVSMKLLQITWTILG